MDNIEGKLVAYFNGSLTDDEKALVDQWSESDVENEKAFADAKRIHASASEVSDGFFPDVDKRLTISQ